MKYTVLQFCDFYTATMAYWVTVLAMGGLPEQAKSLLHMVGAIGVAMAIEYDRTGVFTFLALWLPPLRSFSPELDQQVVLVLPARSFSECCLLPS